MLKLSLSLYSSVDGSPKFTKEIFNMLTLKCEKLPAGGKLLSSLSFDENAIRQHYLEFDRKNMYGYVDMGIETKNKALL